MKSLRCLLLLSFLFILSCSGKEDYLSAPSNVQIIELTSNSVVLQWDTVKDATHYRWTLSPDDPLTVTESGASVGGGVSPDNIVQVPAKHIAPGTLYHFSVRSENKNKGTPAAGGYYPQVSEWTKFDFTTPTD